MTKRKPKPNLQELVSQAQSKQPNGATCWYRRLPNEPQEFVDMLSDAIRSGNYVNFAEVSRILRTRFDFKIGEMQIRRHFKGRCCCAQEE